MLPGNQITQFLLTSGVVVIALALALIGCLLLGGKERRAIISAGGLMVLETLPLFFFVRPAMALDYYGLLFTEALFGFILPVCMLVMVCSVWLEWLSPPPQWKVRDYRQRSIVGGVGLTICGTIIAILFLPRVAARLSDIVAGPSFAEGIVEQLSSLDSRIGAMRGDFTIQGESYQVVDLSWYHTLSVGQAVRFAYSPESHYGFSADQMIQAPGGMLLPALVFGIAGL